LVELAGGRRLQELEMSDRGAELLEPALAVQDLLVEQILMVIVERLALEIFVIAVAEGHGRTRQHVFDPAVQARLFPLRRVQSLLDRSHDGFDARAIGFGVALGRARTERLLSPETIFQEIMGAGPQEELKHACTFRFEAPDQKMGPGWLIKLESFAPFGAALRHPGPPGALVLLVELEPAPFTGIRPHVTALGRHLHPARRLSAVEPLELERLLGRQANQDTPATRIDEIAPRRGVGRTGDGVCPRSRHDPLPCRNTSRRRHAGCKSQNTRHALANTMRQSRLRVVSRS
jgi:hypothetical protein